MSEFEGWTGWVQPASLMWEPEDRDYERPWYVTRTEQDQPQYTPDEEKAMMREQVRKSGGFDIDFSLFRCVFSHQPVDLQSDLFADEPFETTGELLNKLSQESLHDYNHKNRTEYEFVSVVKANFYCASGVIFLITFEAKDPYDGLIKPFQTNVHHVFHGPPKFEYCRPKPNQEVKYFGTPKNDAEKDVEKDALEVAKKPRLE